MQGSRPHTGQSEKLRMMERTTWDLGSLTGPTPSSPVSLSLFFLVENFMSIMLSLSLCLLLISRDEHSLDLLVGQQLFTLTQSVSQSVSQSASRVDSTRRKSVCSALCGILERIQREQRSKQSLGAQNQSRGVSIRLPAFTQLCPNDCGY